MFTHHCNFKITAAIGLEGGGVAISASALPTSEEHGVMPFDPHGLLSITLPLDQILVPALPGQEFKLILAEKDDLSNLDRALPGSVAVTAGVGSAVYTDTSATINTYPPPATNEGK